MIYVIRVPMYLLNNDQEPERSVARDDASSTGVGPIKFLKSQPETTENTKGLIAGFRKCGWQYPPDKINS